MLAPGCLHEEPPPPSPFPPPAGDAWTTLFDGVADLPTESEPTETVLSESEFQSILDSWSTVETPYEEIASDLNTVDGTWFVTAADVSAFVDAACTETDVSAVEELERFAPGADLAALPAMNRAIILVPQTCAVTNPEFMDALSNRVLDSLRANQLVEPAAAPSTADPTALTLAYGAACSGLSFGLNNWAKRTFNARGVGGLALTMTIGAAMTQCPEALQDIVGSS
jgi:hypothetical protein